MQTIILICLSASVLAAPQGYQYNQQQSGLPIGVPNFGISSQTASATKTQENHNFLQQTGSAGNLQQTLNGVQNVQQFSTVPSFSQYTQVPQLQNFGFNGIQQQQQSSLINNFSGQQQQFNNFQQQYQVPATVTKDIYVHVAPEDTPDQQYRQPALPPPPPRKHYRIVFIKAPSQSHNNAALRVQQAPAEEKTIIYVLTKKTDPLDLQTALLEAQPKQPSKPEVYFIKYKTKEEAQYAQRTIQAQYDQLGGTSQISNEGVAPVTSVIGSLDGSSSQFGLDSSSSISTSSSSVSSNRNVNSSSKYLPPIVKF